MIFGAFMALVWGYFRRFYGFEWILVDFFGKESQFWLGLAYFGWLAGLFGSVSPAGAHRVEFRGSRVCLGHFWPFFELAILGHFLS